MTFESVPVVLPALTSDLLHHLCSEGPEFVLQEFPALRGHEDLLQEILETEAGIADLEGRTADLREKADALGSKVREILAAAPEASR